MKSVIDRWGGAYEEAGPRCKLRVNVCLNATEIMNVSFNLH